MEEKSGLGYKELFSDFHIHSRFSRACSKSLNIPNLVKWARIKGLDFMGTGDFTHNVWLSELKELKIENGILWFEDSVGRFPFILSSEISLIYTANGKGRRVHLVYLAPDFEAVDKINAWLDTKGRRDYDGRPIFKISCRDFAAKMEEIDERIEVIPAHVWTPHFGVFGSGSGFDSLKEAFEDKIDRIHAIETGISSDPSMNWKIKEVAERNISIVSFSDLHSYWPWRIGREATIFRLGDDEDLTYDLILKQIRENSFIGTVEVDPNYGKYHYDGHRNCDFSCSPKETRELNGKCPKCGKDMIIGVEYRVDELASEESDYLNKKKYHTLLPLHEIISLGIGIGVNSKGCWKIYDKLIESFGTEFEIMLRVGEENLMNVLRDELIVSLIMKNRKGDIKVKPGYDGVYGEAILEGVERGKKSLIDKKKVEIKSFDGPMGEFVEVGGNKQNTLF
jgi:uncharacterized protein (TIGR00375 family)